MTSDRDRRSGTPLVRSFAGASSRRKRTARRCEAVYSLRLSGLSTPSHNLFPLLPGTSSHCNSAPPATSFVPAARRSGPRQAPHLAPHWLAVDTVLVAPHLGHIPRSFFHLGGRS